MEIYQWLLRRNRFSVAKTAYFVFVNAEKDRDRFHGKLEFSAQISRTTATTTGSTVRSWLLTGA
jgi:hypothetical protein